MSQIIKFFDKLEDKIRGRLSHYPILYAFVCAVGIVLFWRGVWHIADLFAAFALHTLSPAPDIVWYFYPTEWIDGIGSMLTGAVFLLMSGLFVSNFIGNEIIISGLRHEKKLAEKTEQEVEEIETEAVSLTSIKKELQDIINDLDAIKKKIK